METKQTLGISPSVLYDSIYYREISHISPKSSWGSDSVIPFTRIEKKYGLLAALDCLSIEHFEKHPEIQKRRLSLGCEFVAPYIDLWNSKYPNDTRPVDCYTEIKSFIAGKSCLGNLRFQGARSYAANLGISLSKNKVKPIATAVSLVAEGRIQLCFEILRDVNFNIISHTEPRRLFFKYFK